MFDDRRNEGLWSVLRHAACLLIIVTVACTCGPTSAAVQTTTRNDAAELPYRTVLVAGDGRLPVFDNATKAMRDRLLAHRGTIEEIQRLSATPSVIAQKRVREATLDFVKNAIAELHPNYGQSCLVYATSHGAPERGLYLAPSNEFLTPVGLDRALVRGCGDAPTIVIVSGCFSGNFAKSPMNRVNRIVLTAARPDRASFGCGAGREYTVYDACLLTALDDDATWQEVYRSIQACVMRAENGFGFPPSEPQAYFGLAVADLPTGLSRSQPQPIGRTIDEGARVR